MAVQWPGTVLGVAMTWAKAKLLVWLCPPWLQFLINIDDHWVQCQNISIFVNRCDLAIGWAFVDAAVYSVVALVLFTQIPLWHYMILTESLTGFLPRLITGFLAYIDFDKQMNETTIETWTQKRNLAVTYWIACYTFTYPGHSWRVVVWLLIYIILPGLIAGVLYYHWNIQFGKINVIYTFTIPVLVIIGQVTDWADSFEEIVVYQVPRQLQKLIYRFEIWRGTKQRLARYRYSPIGEHEIRLLELGKAESVLVSTPTIRLRVVTLDEAKRLGYEAISYRWYGSERDETIVVDGLRMSITKSGLNVLFTRTSRFHRRLLWIDAICINQEDDVEKGLQVRMMTQIYFHAQRVVICPERVWRPRLVGWTIHSYKRPPAYNDPEDQTTIDHARVYKAAIAPPRWRALDAFIENEYFSRAWVVQEIVAATKIEIYLGGLHVNWVDLYILINNLAENPNNAVLMSKIPAFTERSNRNLNNKSRPLTIPKLESAQQRIQIIAALRADFDLIVPDAVPITLERTLLETQGFHATDPRDFVFAMTGMAYNDPRAAALRPDYVSPLWDIYETTAHFLFLSPRNASIDLLALAGIGHEHQDAQRRTWVPNFGQGRDPKALTGSLYTFDKYSAAGQTTIGTKFGPIKGSLGLYGIFCDTLTCLSEAPALDLHEQDRRGSMIVHHANRKHANYHDAIIKLIEDWGCSSSNDRRTQSIEMRADLWRIIVGNRLKCLEHVKHDLVETFEFLLAGLRTMAELETLDDYSTYIESQSAKDEHKLFLDGSFIQYMMAITELCVGRRFGISARGSACFVPAKSQIGDRIFIPAGSQVPYLVRETPFTVGAGTSSTRLWELVGECYAHGIMNGEAIENPRLRGYAQSCWITLI